MGGCAGKSKNTALYQLYGVTPVKDPEREDLASATNGTGGAVESLLDGVVYTFGKIPVLGYFFYRESEAERARNKKEANKKLLEQLEQERWNELVYKKVLRTETPPSVLEAWLSLISPKAPSHWKTSP